jgi:hypothetical protein
MVPNKGETTLETLLEALIPSDRQGMNLEKPTFKLI